MKTKLRTLLFASPLLVGGIALCDLNAATPTRSCQSRGSNECAPVGGWFRYGGGLLSWWPSCCFPSCGAPDDYCRKPLPNVCWPPYSADFTWAPAESWPADCGCAVDAQH